jgi:hypothetical protein
MRVAVLLLALSGIFLGYPGTGWALESSARVLQRETSELREFSMKPLAVYSARGRRDPFVTPLVASLHNDDSTLKISELSLVGVLSLDSHQVALFRTYHGREQTFILRAGSLYNPDGQAIANVSGKVLGPHKAFLRQGDQELTYEFRPSQDVSAH